MNRQERRHGLNHSRTSKRPACEVWSDAGAACGKNHLSKSALGSYYQVQSANTIVDAVSATIMKQHNPGLTAPQLRQLIAAHIDEDSFCRYVIQQDISKIALDLREAHKDVFFSVPEDNPLEDFLQTADEVASPDSDPEQAAMAFICKRLKLNYGKLSEEEKKWLKRIAQKSDLLKNPNPQRGRK